VIAGTFLYFESTCFASDFASLVPVYADADGAAAAASAVATAPMTNVFRRMRPEC
jgi:hypothetical protein